MGVRDRLGEIAAEFSDVLGNALPARCPIPWRPNALAPVFSGFRDYAPSRFESEKFRAFGIEHATVELGAPRMRVWFPSTGGSPQHNEILQPCGRYPLVVFAHGECGATPEEYHLTWGDNPIVRQQARAGYVVVVPQLTASGPAPGGDDRDLGILRRVLEWMRTDWQHANLLADPPATALIGHSFGGANGARLVVEEGNISAYVSLSGDFQALGDAVEAIDLVTSIEVPKLFTFALPDEHKLDNSWIPPTSGEEREPGSWHKLLLPRHGAAITKMKHFDYLAPEVAPCQDEPGPCLRAPRLIADIVTMFLARYLPPPAVPRLPERIPPTLLPPADWEAGLSAKQISYTGAYLTGVGAWPISPPECRLDLSFETSTTSGVLTLP